MAGLDAETGGNRIENSAITLSETLSHSVSHDNNWGWRDDSGIKGTAALVKPGFSSQHHMVATIFNPGNTGSSSDLYGCCMHAVHIH